MNIEIEQEGDLIGRSLVFKVVENLGLCVELTDDLEAFLRATYWVQIALCAAGILGSGLAVAVCVKRPTRSPCCLQLLLLALYDLLFLLVCLALAACFVCGVWGRNDWTKALLAVRVVALWGANYTTLDICADRCVSVARPILAHCHLSAGLVKRKSVAVLALGAVFTVPYVLDLVYGYSVGQGCGSRGRGQDRQLTEFGVTYTLYTTLLLLHVLPFAVIVVVNVAFAAILCRRRRPQRLAAGGGGGESSATRAERQLSALVLGLSGWYCLSMLAPSVLFLARLTRLELFQPETDIRVAAAADVLIVLCCGCNFFFYLLLWRPFRRVLGGWLQGSRLRLRTSRSSSSTCYVLSDGRSHGGGDGGGHGGGQYRAAAH